MKHSLPIDEKLQAIGAAVRARGGAVVVAQPGAGKTTRVPSFLQQALKQTVLCTQPRRIAARLSALRVAQERGCRIGAQVGYEVRFDKQTSANTTLTFMTEGLALRKFTAVRPEILILDEFHERHLDADMLLAIAAQMRRENLANGPSIVVMSATIDAGPIAEFLDVPLIVSEGRSYPVDVQYQVPRTQERLETMVSRGIKTILRDDSDRGDILVFLPGIAEIRRCKETLQQVATARSLQIVTLHGGASAREQDAALKTIPDRKIILSTNIAETSVTIDGVTTVVDAGTARVASHSPWTGLSSLTVTNISQASAVQRAGRAGRTAPGRALRLYSEHDFNNRPGFDSSEITRSDLASAQLFLASAGQSLDSLAWLQDPPPKAVQRADELLLQLGAYSANGKTTLSPVGKQMSALSIHPRLARLVIAAVELGVGSQGARAAALLSARPLRHRQRSATTVSTSDVIDDLELLHEWRQAKRPDQMARAAGIDSQVAKSTEQVAQQILRSLPAQKSTGSGSQEQSEESLLRALLAGFPDRAARRIQPRSETVLLCKGGQVQLSAQSAVTEANYLLAIDIETRSNSPRQSRTQVRVASQIDPEWLLDLPGISDRDEYEYHSEGERVTRRTGIYYGDIAIDEERIVDPTRMDETLAADCLKTALVDGKWQQVVDVPELDNFRRRIAFTSTLRSDLQWPEISTEEVATTLLNMANRPTRLSDLKSLSVVEGLYWALGSNEQKALTAIAPTHIGLPGRKRVPVHYEVDRPPWIESRLQDFFGAQSPTVGGGSIPLTLHLLAPNRRAVQVTSDLPGFWERHYPALRKQLMRRYPRHAWPEDPSALLSDTGGRRKKV